MPSKTQPRTLQDFLYWACHQDFCIEIVTFRHAAGVNASFQPGEVLELSTGKYIPLATAANAVAILAEPVDDLATATDKTVKVLRRGPALVNEDQLDVNGQSLAATMTALEAFDIRAKKQPIKRTDF